MWIVKTKEINYIYILQFRHLAGNPERFRISTAAELASLLINQYKQPVKASANDENKLNTPAVLSTLTTPYA